MKSQSIHLIAFALTFIATSLAAFAQNNRAAINPNLTQAQRVGRFLSTQDTDKDDRISRAESTGLMKSNFNRNDTNKDGYLDKKELASLADRLAKTVARSNTNNTRNRNNAPPMPDAQLREMAPNNINLHLNVPYNDQHERQVLDIFTPKAKSSTPRPVVIFIHGGGWTSGDKRRGVFLTLALEYASRGYVTLTTNYRLDNTKLPCIQDTKTAVRWLRANAAKYNIDPNRIGAFGNSAGAHLVTMLGISHTDKSLDVGPYLQYSSAVPRLYHSSSPLPLADPIFDSNVDPNRSQLWRLVNVDVLVVMGVNITEDDGVSITSHLDHPVWMTGRWRQRNHDDFGRRSGNDQFHNRR